MTNPATKEQLQAINPAMKQRAAELLQSYGVTTGAYDLGHDLLAQCLALQSLDREGVKKLDRYDRYANHDGERAPSPELSEAGEWVKFDDIQALSPRPETPRYRIVANADQSIGYFEHPEGEWVSFEDMYFPQPETAKEVRETEAVPKPFFYAMRERANGTPHFDELCVSSDPAELEDYYSDDPSVEVIPVYTHPAPQSPPAPVVDDQMVERALNTWFNGDVPLAYNGQFMEEMRAALKAALEGRS